MTILRVTVGQEGRRAYVLSHRFHHGLLGALFVLVGGWLCWTDRHDFPWTND